MVSWKTEIEVLFHHNRSLSFPIKKLSSFNALTPSLSTTTALDHLTTLIPSCNDPSSLALALFHSRG